VEFPCGCCCCCWWWLWWWKKELNWLSLCSIFRLDSRRCVTLQKKNSIFLKIKLFFVIIIYSILNNKRKPLYYWYILSFVRSVGWLLSSLNPLIRSFGTKWQKYRFETFRYLEHQ
jgi:hypothetical protein